MSRCATSPLAREIYFMARGITNLAEKILAPFELTLEQLQTLEALTTESGISQRQVGEMVNKNPANLTRILDRLEVKSYIVRRADPHDRRAYLIFLTAGGAALLAEVKEVFTDFSKQLHHGVTPEMEETTRTVLAIIATNIATIERNFAPGKK